MRRRNEEENPLPVESLAAETERGSDSTALLPNRLERYARAKKRGLAMRDYIAKVLHQTSDSQKVAHRLHECGSYLVFRQYLTAKRARLIGARTCKQHILCPFCAIRRGAKMQAAYTKKVQHLLSENPHLTPWMVTFTVKNGDSLSERYAHLHKSVKAMNKNRTRGDRGHEIMKAQGSVWSYEFKRGSGSGLWHPHMHAVWLCSSPLDVEKLSKEWQQITGDSYIIEAHPMYGDPIEAFAEVFKYAVKFGDLPLVDNWNAFEVLRGKRLVRSAGILWGVEVPESDLDEMLDDPLFVDIVYRYFHETDNYKPTGSRDSSQVEAETIERPKGPRPMLVDGPVVDSLHLRQLKAKYA